MKFIADIDFVILIELLFFLKILKFPVLKINFFLIK
jgi:hypothetical protein